MNTYINKIRDLLIDCMPEHWYKAYLYFESTETGSMTSAYYYVKTPAGSIISYGDLLYNCSTEKVNTINDGINKILTNVRLLHNVSEDSWTWGTMYISRDDYEPHCEFHNDPVTDDYWLQNRYKWEYQNFGVLAREDEFDPHVYKEMLKGPRGILLLEDMESRVLAKNYTAIDKAFKLKYKSLESELEKHYNKVAKSIYKLTPLNWHRAKLHFEMNVDNPSVELLVYKTEDDSCITKYVENNDKEPAIISEVMYDLKNEILAMIETFKFYNQNPFSGLVYTLTSNGEVSLELTYGDK
ncbi:immunity protein YezG family protein [uncultured Veillonella sp.]|uniref:immunity protein YezG family protein n=1 Tax=uncultured Veillonella sp. TaxID=159268 RepID=UPI00266F7E2F|nr:immunity protein YezG family protein [uncultured Veillonella sp.]